MKRMALLLLACLLALLLTACGQPDTAPASSDAATPAPTAAKAPAVTAQGALGDAARQLMAPYQDELDLVARHSPGVLTYEIPGDIINTLAQDAAEAGAQAENGRYAFTWRQSGEHTYSASALQIAQIEEAAEATPNPRASEEPVMDNQQMGDFSASGGGLFERARAYDVAADLTDGAAEMTDTLNGGVTGHELFSFAVEGDCLYFVDAMLDQAVGLDGVEATSRYLVAAGVLRRDGLEIVEFTVPGRDQVPPASAASWSGLLSSVSPLSHITAQGERVTTSP